MRNRFRYSPPRPMHLATYAVAAAGLLPAIHFWGAPAWSAVAETLTIPGAIIGGGFAFYMAWFWMLGGLYLVADAKGWWSAHRIQVRKRGAGRSGPSVGGAIAVVLRNQLLGTLPALVLFYLAMEWRGIDMAGPPDDIGTMLVHLGIIVLVEEVLFYTVHRTMHRPKLFRQYHRVHHEFRETIGIATHYVHYAEHWLVNLLPVFAGVLLVGAHPVTTLLWVGLAVTNAIHTHAGYSLPWMPWAVDHDFHHHNTKGGYGAMGVLDRLLGTDSDLRRVARRSK